MFVVQSLPVQKLLDSRLKGSQEPCMAAPVRGAAEQSGCMHVLRSHAAWRPALGNCSVSRQHAGRF
jgi:hypothetical protein